MRKENTKYNLPLEIRRLSVVMPVYNEYETIENSLKNVLSEDLGPISLELIVVESASNDGTHEIVKNLEPDDRIIKIFEPSPMGKGHAVRAGLEVATGDVIVIFDADDEYRFSDVHVLLQPIQKGEASFVLGSRHSIGKKVREFDRHRWLSVVMNGAHLFFAFLINVSFDVSIRDPFTMWKVFRRELLATTPLVSNRFDLDWEIICKFAMQGYIPKEIPITYVSRDYAHGKKVRLVRDPISWLVLLVNLRFTKKYRELVTAEFNDPS
ncbi:MAG: glycosyltransferase family 2 protein [Actinomycetota bacterium]|nr:glycosyltransferase family 2 protein [Actinomycetota bacterium]